MIEETIASAAHAMIMDWVTHAVNGPLLTNSGMPLVQSGTPQTDQFASSSMKSTLGQPRTFFTEVERPAVINPTKNSYIFYTYAFRAV